MKTYRNKNNGAIVKAVALTRDNAERLAATCGGLLVEEIDPQVPDRKYPAINVPTPDGNKRLQEGFYLVIFGTDFYVSRPPNFESVHEEVAG